MDSNNNHEMVAFKAELKEELFGQEEPVTADSQVVMGAGEVVIKEEMDEVPSDEGVVEAPSDEEEDDDEDPFSPSTNLLLEVEDDGHVVVGGDVGEDDSEEVLVSFLASLAASGLTSSSFRTLLACMVLAGSATTSLLSLWLCLLWQRSSVGVPLPSSWTRVRRRETLVRRRVKVKRLRMKRLRMGVM